MGANWKTYKLREVAEIIIGGTPSTSVPEYWNGNIKWVTAKDISESATTFIKDTERKITELGLHSSSAKLLPTFSTVLIARGATMGKCRLLAEEMALNQTCYGIVAKDNVDPRFLYYFLSQLETYFNDVSHGTVFNTIIASGLAETPLILPPPSEQRTIAHILGSLDDKIEANRRMNETLEDTARALFKSWFVDFAPVHYKSRGEQPPGLDADTAALFPDSFEDSELGLIPRGWAVGTIGDLAEFNGWTLSKKDDLDFIEYIEISEVMRGEIGVIKIYARGEEPSRARRRLRHGDTVLSTVRPDRGAYFLCLNPTLSLIASTGFVVFTPLNPYWGFLHTTLIRPEVFERLGSLADGAAYPAVAPEAIANLALIIPPENLVSEFHGIVAPIYEQVEQNRLQSRTLAKTRDALLPKLVSGEIRVGDVEGL